jgi:hypothetical protein
MQTINEARAAKVFVTGVALVAACKAARPSVPAWQLLLKKFLANLMSALAAPAI